MRQIQEATPAAGDCAKPHYNRKIAKRKSNAQTEERHHCRVRSRFDGRFCGRACRESFVLASAAKRSEPAMPTIYGVYRGELMPVGGSIAADHGECRVHATIEEIPLYVGLLELGERAKSQTCDCTSRKQTHPLGWGLCFRRVDRKKLDPQNVTREPASFALD